MYGKAHEQKDFKVPGKCETSEKKIARNLECDPFLVQNNAVLHRVVRQPGKPHQKELLQYKKLFQGPHSKITAKDLLDYDKVLNKAIREELKHYDVVFTTCTVAVSPNLLAATEGCIYQIVIDEAGMCTEPLTIVPIIANNPKQVVLIGDHQQLQPIVKCREAANLGLRISLFERYANMSDVSSQYLTLLETQYRMNEHICEFPSSAFYGGKLKTGEMKTSGIGHRITHCGDIWRNPTVPLAFFDISGVEETLTVKTSAGNEKSKSNKEEVEKVKEIYSILCYQGISPSDINVMSQYNAQCDALKNVLQQEFDESCIVNTVVGSQGGEWDYVIFSTVRSRPDFLIDDNPPATWLGENLGFITDKHQINVALTRARKGLIIVGNMKLLETHDLWKNLIQHFWQNGCVHKSYRYDRKQ